MIYRVLRSTSLGYELYDNDKKETILAPNRKKITYRGEKIVIGDFVTLDSEGIISEVEPRKNACPRPRLSNCDMAYVLSSCKEPDFDSYLLDKFLSFLNYYSIPSSILFSKADLLKVRDRKKLEKVATYYRSLSYPVYFIDAKDPSRFDFPIFRESLRGKSVAFVGQTGVGKSSLINTIAPDFKRKVDALYVTSGRGRHTTKEVVLLPFEDSFLFDTPGFSELELKDIKTLDFASSFPGYGAYFGKCAFKDCRHLPSAKGCAVLKAMEEGKLSEESYQNYLRIYEDVKENDAWKKKRL